MNAFCLIFHCQLNAIEYGEVRCKAAMQYNFDQYNFTSRYLNILRSGFRCK